jgi:hypothetical protein
MLAILHFITLVVTTLFAAAAAALVNWLLLRGAFHLMRPATAARPRPSGERHPDARRIASGNCARGPGLWRPPLSLVLRPSFVDTPDRNAPQKKGAPPCWL